MNANATTADGDEENRRTYKVPITAHGGVYVVASDEEEAVEEAVNAVDSGELETSRDIDLERVREDEPAYGTPANVSDPDPETTYVSVPSFPTVDELRRAREELDLTLSEVAEWLDVSASGVGKWERGDRAISLEQARNYASVLSRLSRDEEQVLDALNRRDP